jgi:beta-mannosidase
MAGPRAPVVAAAAALLMATLATAAPASTASASSALARASLNGGWSLANKNGSLSFSDVLLPNYPINELGKAGVIGDPLYRYNELEVRWVTDDTWTYEKEFETPAGMVGGDGGNGTDGGPASVDLVLSGLDTYAFVELNGEQVLYADNFHREWRVPVKELLKPAGNGEKNKLRITLPPATATALELKKKLPYLINTLSAPGAIDVYNFVRKPAYSFGWGEC